MCKNTVNKKAELTAALYVLTDPSLTGDVVVSRAYVKIVYLGGRALSCYDTTTGILKFPTGHANVLS